MREHAHPSRRAHDVDRPKVPAAPFERVKPCRRRVARAHAEFDHVAGVEFFHERDERVEMLDDVARRLSCFVVPLRRGEHLSNAVANLRTEATRSSCDPPASRSDGARSARATRARRVDLETTTRALRGATLRRTP